MDPTQLLMRAAQAGDPRAAQLLRMFAANPNLAALNARPYMGQRTDRRLTRIMDERAAGKSKLLRSAMPHLFGLAPGSVHIPTGLETQLQAYANRELIADQVLPVLPVKKQSNKIWELPLPTFQTIANVQIAGGRGRPSELAYSVDANLSYNCVPYGLLDPTPLETIENADAPLNPRLLSAEVTEAFLDLAREYRVSQAVFNPANYGTNTVALTGSSRIDNPASDPVQMIIVAKESIFTTSNVLVVGGAVWPYLRTHPAVIKYILTREKTSIGQVPGIMVRKYLAEMLELDDVVVGRARYVTSNEGAASLTTDYLWGKCMALLRVEAQPSERKTSCFGYTYRWGSRSYRHEIITDLIGGGMGVEYLKLAHFDAEVILAAATATNPSGFLWTTAIN